MIRLNIDSKIFIFSVLHSNKCTMVENYFKHKTGKKSCLGQLASQNK